MKNNNLYKDKGLVEKKTLRENSNPDEMEIVPEQYEREKSSFTNTRNKLIASMQESDAGQRRESRLPSEFLSPQKSD